MAKPTTTPQDEDFLYEALDIEGMQTALAALGGPFDLDQLLAEQQGGGGAGESVSQFY